MNDQIETASERTLTSAFVLQAIIIQYNEKVIHIKNIDALE